MGALIGDTGVKRVTLALDPEDVDLLDRLAALEESNRSAELRGILRQVRPMLQSTVVAFEAANAARDRMLESAAQASMAEFQGVLPELERLQNAFLGTMARLEGAAAAATEDPRPSNHGGHNSNPPTLPGFSSAGDDA